jgi:aldose 1-epimerase
MNTVVLRPRDGTQNGRARFIDAIFTPACGLSLTQAHADLPNRGPVELLCDSLSFGGAVLLPFANRIRGRLRPDGQTIDVDVLGRRVQLLANWSGTRPNAEHCAMHGMLFNRPMRIADIGPDYVVAVLDAGDFSGHWPSRTYVQIAATLSHTCLDLSVTVQNTGNEPLPIGIGWHPYFAIPSGDREHARLHIPATHRACVTNYDDVFPTGKIVETVGTPYDFTSADGRPLGTQYFDDMFVDLEKTSAGHTRVELRDPGSSYHMRLTATSRQVTAVQLYAPSDRAFAVIEPQFNWADPFGRVWAAEVNTGMVVLRPDADVTWAVQWNLF